MSKIQSQLLRGKIWIQKIGATLLLLVSIPTLRKADGSGVKQIQIPKGVYWEPVEVDGVHCERLSPPDAPTDVVLLHLHGGGGVLGITNSRRVMTGYISLACNLRVLLPDYRLAPEHPFPLFLTSYSLMPKLIRGLGRRGP